MTNPTWNNYDPAKPPGKDDYPILIHGAKLKIPTLFADPIKDWADATYIKAWMPIPKYAPPPEPELPKLADAMLKERKVESQIIDEEELNNE